MRFEGIVRKFYRLATTDAPVFVRLTQLGSLAVANVEARNQERARSGRRFMGGCQAVGSGIAPVGAIPTTTATLAVYNTAPDGGKCLVFDHLGFFLGQGTAAAGATLLVTVTVGKPTAPSAAANYSSQSCNGFGASVARWATALTIPAGSAWIQAISSLQSGAANAGQGDVTAQLDGSLIVPPGHALGLAVLSGSGSSPLYSISAIWDEIEMDLD